MPATPDFELTAAHKYFAANCFNSAWDLIDKTERSEDEKRRMLLLSQASIWHWTQREDCTNKNLCVGYWQASRVYALLGEPDNARRAGQISLEFGREEAPFFLGYSYEALARAEAIAGDSHAAHGYLEKARDLAEQVTDSESKKMLLADLQSIKP